MEMTEKYQEQAITLSEQAKTLKVVDQATYIAAGEFAKGIKDLKNQITSYFKPLKEAAHKAHKAITQKEADELKPLDEADATIRQIMVAYLAAQEKIRKAEQAELEAKAEQAAKAEQEKLLKQAVKAESKGDTDKATALIEKAGQVYIEPVFAEVVAKTVKTIDNTNITTLKDIKVTVVDIHTFLAAVVNGAIPVNFIQVKENDLKKWIKLTGAKTIAGCKIEETYGVRI